MKRRSPRHLSLAPALLSHFNKRIEDSSLPFLADLKPLAPLSLRSRVLKLILGASLFDIFSPRKITYSMGLYDLACAAGPTLGPIVAGFAVVANGWRWAFWEMLWITGFALALLSFSMPEVSLPPSFSSSFYFSPPSAFKASLSCLGIPES